MEALIYIFFWSSQPNISLVCPQTLLWKSMLIHINIIFWSQAKHNDLVHQSCFCCNKRTYMYWCIFYPHNCGFFQEEYHIKHKHKRTNVNVTLRQGYKAKVIFEKWFQLCWSWLCICNYWKKLYIYLYVSWTKNIITIQYTGHHNILFK